jgi:hypothetical protein
MQLGTGKTCPKTTHPSESPRRERRQNNRLSVPNDRKLKQHVGCWIQHCRILPLRPSFQSAFMRYCRPGSRCLWPLSCWLSAWQFLKIAKNPRPTSTNFFIFYFLFFIFASAAANANTDENPNINAIANATPDKANTDADTDRIKRIPNANANPNKANS